MGVPVWGRNVIKLKDVSEEILHEHATHRAIRHARASVGIAGIGNHNTAKFWEYDTRIARRWNLDPVPQISISDYAVMGDNPIWRNDVLGDEFRNTSREKLNKNLNDRKDALDKLDGLRTQRDRAGSSLKGKDLKKLNQEINKTERQIHRLDKSIQANTLLADFVDGALEKMKDVNPEWYNYWDNLKVKNTRTKQVENVIIGVSASTLIHYKDGSPTTESIDIGMLSGGVPYANMKLEMPIGLTNADRTIKLTERARDAAHAVGHLWMMWQNIEKKGENDAEGQANKYMERVFQQKPIYEINSWDY